MPGRWLIVAVSVIVALATGAGCGSSARSDKVPVASPLTPSSSNGSPAANEPQALSAADRALAVAAAHQEAAQIAVGRNGQQVSGWPSGISAVTAVVQPGTVSDSNTGHTCASGAIISVQLVGAFDTVTTGTTASPDTTVREIDLRGLIE